MTTRRISEPRSLQVRTVAGNRCGYCLTHQRYAMQVLEIEHIIPKAKGGTNDDDNLWLACRLCNNAKGVQPHDYDPLTGRRASSVGWVARPTLRKLYEYLGIIVL